MGIKKIVEGGKTTIVLDGRLDTNSSPELESELELLLPSVSSLTFDLSALSYISSAGLRVLLMAQKAMNTKRGPMVVRHCNADIMEIFNVTGFVDILTIEE